MRLKNIYIFVCFYIYLFGLEVLNNDRISGKEENKRSVQGNADLLTTNHVRD
jgi:hypothetical protein